MAANLSPVTRVPLYRTGEPRITPRAVEIFRQIRRLRCVAGDARCDRCEACERWHDLHADLNREIGACPWHWPCIAHDYKRGSAAQRALWDALEDAARAARKAAVN
jgi:hypothetical protein